MAGRRARGRGRSRTAAAARVARQPAAAAALTEAIMAYQRELGLADGTLATRIGVSRTLWVQIRRGQVPATPAFASKVAQSGVAELRVAALALIAPEPPAATTTDATEATA